jgi:CRP-like cAMP-binding protein
MYFIVDGITRYFVIEENGDERTSLFMVSGEFTTDAISFYQKTIAYGNVQAETDCKLIQISHDVFELLGQNLTFWYPFFNETSSVFFQSVLKLNRQILHLEAKEAYVNFLKLYPNIENLVPLQHIASYLGITPHSLSRIRKELS